MYINSGKIAPHITMKHLLKKKVNVINLLQDTFGYCSLM